MSDSDLQPPEREPTSHDEPDDLQYVVHHAAFPETRFSQAIDQVIRKIGSALSWLWIALMFVICVNVFMKNALGQGSVRFEEIQWHIYSAVFLLGLSYTMTFDDHVRVDLLHEGFRLRTKAWIEVIGIVVFLLPFLIMLLYYAWPFVVKAFTDGERSSSPAGLAYYWIIKSTLVIGLVMLLATSIARLQRCIAFLANDNPPSPGTDHAATGAPEQGEG